MTVVHYVLSGVVVGLLLAWLRASLLARRQSNTQNKRREHAPRCRAAVALMPQDTPGPGQPILSVRCALWAGHSNPRSHLIDPADLYELGLVRPPF